MSVERHLSERTATEYCRDIRRFEKWLKADGKILNKAKVKRIRRWVTGLMADGSNKPQSVHRKIAALHAYFKWLVRDGRRDENPVDAVERPKCEKRLPHCASESEVGQFLTTKLHRKNPAHELRDHAMHGADIVTLKELLGHTNIATTNTYVNVSMEHMRSTFQKTHPRAK